MLCPTTGLYFPVLRSPARENRAPSGKAEEVRWPATLEPAFRRPGLGTVSAAHPRMQPLQLGAALPTLIRGGKHFESRGGGRGEGGARSRVLPFLLPAPARARGNSGAAAAAAAAARRLSYSASSWTRHQTAEQRDYARSGNRRPGLLLGGGGLLAPEAES